MMQGPSMGLAFLDGGGFSFDPQPAQEAFNPNCGFEPSERFVNPANVSNKPQREEARPNGRHRRNHPAKSTQQGRHVHQYTQNRGSCVFPIAPTKQISNKSCQSCHDTQSERQKACPVESQAELFISSRVSWHASTSCLLLSIVTKVLEFRGRVTGLQESLPGKTPETKNISMDTDPGGREEQIPAE